MNELHHKPTLYNKYIPLIDKNLYQKPAKPPIFQAKPRINKYQHLINTLSINPPVDNSDNSPPPNIKKKNTSSPLHNHLSPPSHSPTTPTLNPTTACFPPNHAVPHHQPRREYLPSSRITTPHPPNPPPKNVDNPVNNLSTTCQ